MKVFMTEYLSIDLDKEVWECRHCGHEIGPARENYKQGLLVYDRDPREIHRPLIDPARYRFTFAPDPRWCRILEFYCPDCGTMVEVEYTVPGHPPLHDMEFDIDALKAQWRDRQPMAAPAPAPDDEIPLKRHCHGHGHAH